MPFCFNCGNEIKEDMEICPKCGQQQQAVCKRCGRCCKEVARAGSSLRATTEDISRWKHQRREDILSRVAILPDGSGSLWFTPMSDEELSHSTLQRILPSVFRKPLNICPFLKQVGRKEYECTIYQTWPEQCGDWDCVLCWNSFKKGETVGVGAHDYEVSNLDVCPECQKQGICKTHSFVSTQWLEKYLKKA